VCYYSIKAYKSLYRMRFAGAGARILSPLRLRFSHTGRCLNSIAYFPENCKRKFFRTHSRSVQRRTLEFPLSLSYDKIKNVKEGIL